MDEVRTNFHQNPESFDYVSKHASTLSLDQVQV